jgi:cytochrome P450
MSAAPVPAQQPDAGADTLPTTRPARCPFDPPPELSRFRAEQPLRRMTYPDGHQGWLITSHELSRAVLADTRFSSRMDLRRSAVRRPGMAPFLGKPAAPGMFIAMDPPDHTRYRRLLTGQFTVRRMRQLEPRIEQITEQHLDAMEQAGPPVDLVQAFALPIPSLVICEMLGVDYADPSDARSFLDPALGVARRIDMEALRRGLIVYSTQPTADGWAGDQTLIAPAFTSSEEELALVVERMAATVEAVERELREAMPTAPRGIITSSVSEGSDR